MGDPGGAAAPDDDEVGEFSDEELVDLPEGDDDDDYWQSIRWHFLFFACVLKKGGYKSLGGTDLPGGGL